MIPKKKELPPAPVVPQPSPVCTFPIWKHWYPGSSFVRLAGVFGASAVALGAYGAHGRLLRSKHHIRFKRKIIIIFVNAYIQYEVRTISLVFIVVTAIYPKESRDELKKIYETANRYHFLHSLALLGVPLCRWPKTASVYLLNLC